MADRAQAEIDQMRRKADQVTDESLEATRRMKQLAVDSRAVGAETMVKLDEQGQQLDNIEVRLNDMNADLKQAEKNMTQLERCCGCCLCPCGTKGNKFMKKNKKLHSKAFGNQPITMQPVKGEVGPNKSARGTGTGQQGYVERVTDDAREDEMDKNLGEVSNILGDLKNMALDMGNELEKQNNQLDRINTKAESNEARLKSANEQAKRIERS